MMGGQCPLATILRLRPPSLLLYLRFPLPLHLLLPLLFHNHRHTSTLEGRRACRAFSNPPSLLPPLLPSPSLALPPLLARSPPPEATRKGEDATEGPKEDWLRKIGSAPPPRRRRSTAEPPASMKIARMTSCFPPGLPLHSLPRLATETPCRLPRQAAAAGVVLVGGTASVVLVVAAVGVVVVGGTAAVVVAPAVLVPVQARRTLCPPRRPDAPRAQAQSIYVLRPLLAPSPPPSRPPSLPPLPPSLPPTPRASPRLRRRRL
jgi:hypothetical protein